MALRKLLNTRPAKRQDIDYLVTRVPLYPTAGEMLDPFLLLAHHGPQSFPPDNQGMPFGPHPHRGFETVTFILAGELVHRDSGGHESLVGPGGVQWMTAGSGVVHSETASASFLAHGGPLEILQLWVNLPARLKMTSPNYLGVDAPEIPNVPLSNGVTMHLVSGTIGQVGGPVSSLTDVLLSTIKLDGGTVATLPAPAGRTVLFYVVGGEVTIEEIAMSSGTLAVFDDEGDSIEIMSETGASILFGHADPIREPVAIRGPFVMNTDEEIDQAFIDFRAGLLGNAND